MIYWIFNAFIYVKIFAWDSWHWWLYLFWQKQQCRIDVYAAIKINGQRYQAIDIHYNGVGLIKRLPPEEFEKRFQNGKFKKPKLIVEEIEEKEKTA